MHLIKEMAKTYKFDGNEDDVKTIQRIFLRIRDQLRRMTPTKYAYHHAAADLMHLWANTEFFFKPKIYGGVKSSPFTHSELGLPENLHGMNFKISRLGLVVCATLSI